MTPPYILKIGDSRATREYIFYDLESFDRAILKLFQQYPFQLESVKSRFGRVYSCFKFAGITINTSIKQE